MIQIIKQPLELSLDSDNSIIEISTDSIGRIDINTNNALLNQVTVAKYNSTNAIINLKSLYRNTIVSTTEVTNESHKVNNLFTITGDIKQAGDVPSEVSLQPINILYSYKTIERLPSTNGTIHFLGISDSLLCSSNCKLSIPFFSYKSQNISIRVSDQKNNLIKLSLLGSLSGYYVYDLDLALDYNVESITIEIIGEETITKAIRVLKNKVNTPINFRFRNQFGAIINAQLFSNIDIEEELKSKVYSDQDGIQFTSEIESNSIVTIDTGYLLQSELFLIRQLVNSTLVELEINGEYIPVVSTTKKIKVYRDREYITANKLTFTYSNYETN
ncbi:hypothetical protein [Myroides sp.]|uniref:hypothetical protein n=1 Tax=Myroides sp. TaxID=1874736 RepID=UPI003F306066